MREETRKKLERALWLERAKYIGVGLGLVAAIAAAFFFEELDLKVTDTRVAGVVEAVNPLVSKQSAATGLNVEVQLENGRHVRVLALKEHAPTLGDRIEVTEHRHATGRFTYSLR